MVRKSPSRGRVNGPSDLHLEGSVEDEVRLCPRVAVGNDVAAAASLDDDGLEDAVGLGRLGLDRHGGAEHPQGVAVVRSYELRSNGHHCLLIVAS